MSGVFGDALMASRIQFAANITFHILFPALSIGLSWLLAGHLHGWLTAAALDAHEAERQPITEQVATFAMNHALALQLATEAQSVNNALLQDLRALANPAPQGDA